MTIDRKKIFDLIREGVGPLNQKMVDLGDEAMTAIEKLDAERDAPGPDVDVQHMSTKGLIALANREAIVLSAYRDSKGIWTIAGGHTAAAGPPKPVPGMTLTMQQALELFARDVERYAARVRKYVKVKVTQPQFDALVSFDYNTGEIDKAKLVDTLNRGDVQGAGRQFMNWVTPSSLYDRRDGERRQFLTGDYGDTSKVTVYDTYPGKARRVSSAALFPPKEGQALAIMEGPQMEPHMEPQTTAQTLPAPAKPGYKSGTIVASWVAIAVAILGGAGVVLTGDQVNDLTVAAEKLYPFAVLLGTGVVSWYSRRKARAPIQGGPADPKVIELKAEQDNLKRAIATYEKGTGNAPNV
jgi:lysozyme